MDPDRPPTHQLLPDRDPPLRRSCSTAASAPRGCWIPMLQAVLARVPRALVLLSHYHHDHVEGLHYLLHLLRDHEVTIAAPPSSVTRASPADVLGRYGEHAAPAAPDRDLARTGSRRGFELVELKEGKNQVAGETVEVIAPAALGSERRDSRARRRLRDRHDRPEGVRPVRRKRAAVLIHDAWLDAEDEAAGPPRPRASTATAVGAARIAAEAQVRAARARPPEPRATTRRGWSACSSRPCRSSRGRASPTTSRRSRSGRPSRRKRRPRLGGSAGRAGAASRVLRRRFHDGMMLSALAAAPRPHNEIRVWTLQVVLGKE